MEVEGSRQRRSSCATELARVREPSVLEVSVVASCASSSELRRGVIIVTSHAPSVDDAMFPRPTRSVSFYRSTRSALRCAEGATKLPPSSARYRLPATSASKYLDVYSNILLVDRGGGLPTLMGKTPCDPGVAHLSSCIRKFPSDCHARLQ